MTQVEYTVQVKTDASGKKTDYAVNVMASSATEARTIVKESGFGGVGKATKL